MDNTEKTPSKNTELDKLSPEAPEENPKVDAGEPLSPDELREQLTAKTKEAEEFLDKYLRLAAEFDNYKRLASRDQRDHLRFANEGLLKELLVVIDNLERAIRSGSENPTGEALVQGVELTLKQATEILGKFGVRQINSVGEAFDPTRHQAVAQVESDRVPSNTVVEEYQRGYYLHDRVLRAATVTVATSTTSTRSQGEGADPQGGQAQEDRTASSQAPLGENQP